MRVLDYIEVREVKKEDAKSLIRIAQSCSKTQYMIREVGEVSTNLKDKQKEIEYYRKSKNSIYLVGECEGKVVGECCLLGGRFCRSKHRAELSIMVMEGYRGNRIGKRLINRALDICKKLGIEVIELKVVEDNTSAIKLYGSVGFKVVGKIEKYLKINGEYKSAVIMYKEI